MAGPPSPALEIDPIGAAYAPVSRLASLGVAALAWGILGGGCLLAYRMQPAHRDGPSAPREAVSLVLAETPLAPTRNGGGHQGSAPAKAPAPEPVKSAPPPPPPPPQAMPAEVPTPAALPTQMAPPPPAPASAAGVPDGSGPANGHGTGSGTGSGSGAGSGTGTGSGSGSGDGAGSGDGILVPYSQIHLVKVVNPEYPERARQSGLQGEVVVRVTIDENGVPVEFHVLGGEPEFVKETLRVLHKWRFTPVTRLGKRTRASFDAVLRFKLA